MGGPKDANKVYVILSTSTTAVMTSNLGSVDIIIRSVRLGLVFDDEIVGTA